MATAQELHDAEVHSKRANFINEEIADLFGINIVQCPHCSCLMTHPIGMQGDDTIICPVCSITQPAEMGMYEVWECPDFLY